MTVRIRVGVFLVAGALLLGAPLYAGAIPVSITGSCVDQFSTTLRVGAQGDAVADVQAFLRGAGVYDGLVDGVFGAGTERAIRQFQAEHRGAVLTPAGIQNPTGTWGPFTYTYANNMLCRGDVVAVSVQAHNKIVSTQDDACFQQLLSQGDRGPAVEKVQTFLGAQGFLQEDADGIYGAGTYEAVSKFQEAYRADILDTHNLENPTGFWGTATIAKANTFTCEAEDKSEEGQSTTTGTPAIKAPPLRTTQGIF